MVIQLDQELYDASRQPSSNTFTEIEFLNKLTEIRKIIVDKHQSLYIREIDSLINKVKLFGFRFATLDIRQDSRKHNEVFEDVVATLQKNDNAIFPLDYSQKSPKDQVAFLSKVKGHIDIDLFEDEFTYRTLKTMQAIKDIQQNNGKRGANRYIISNNQTALNVMQLYAMLNLVGFGEEVGVEWCVWSCVVLA